MNYKALLNNLFETIIRYGLRFILALFIVTIGFRIGKIIIKKLEKGIGFQRIDKSAQSFIKSFINITLKVLVVIIAASILGVPMTSMVAVLGSLGDRKSVV